MDNGKIIQFEDKKQEKKLKRLKFKKASEAKRLAHLLIDLCEGDFAIIFKSEDMKEHFNGSVGHKDFLVAMTDVEKRDHNHPDYFFRNFGGSKQYFDLEGKGD